VTLWICVACGLEHTGSVEPPDHCAVCVDERQYVPPGGQRWTTSKRQEAGGTVLTVDNVEPGLFRLTVTPAVGIGHQSLLVQTPSGNLLWEPPGFISDRAVAAIRELGGISAVSGSHPHLMGAMVSWSHAFEGAPVFVNEADRAWTMRPDPVITHWSGEAEPVPGIRLVQFGGHFPGSSMLYWPDGAAGRGALLAGDTIMVGPDNKTVSVMRSFPNRIPLPERAVRQILDRLEPLRYDRVYGPFAQVIDSGAPTVVRTSLERYITWVRGDVLDY
jgi:glyoxylase-like metal-dependent hydrolase (beta-lactamase superfamily II)